MPEPEEGARIIVGLLSERARWMAAGELAREELGVAKEVRIEAPRDSVSKIRDIVAANR